MKLLKPSLFRARIQAYEARLIREALQQAWGNQAEAARLLELPPPTLASQLRRLGIQAAEFRCHATPEWPLVP